MSKALVLDFGGVISRTLFETHDLTEAALDLAPGTLTWRGPFDPVSDPLWQRMQAQEITERDYWQHRMAETGALVGETWTEFPQFVGRVRGADPAAVIRPEALDAIAAAKAGGCRLAVLSNELDLFYGIDFRDKLPFLKDFDAVIDATYTKILKPDPRAYGFVTEALNLAAADCVFVDDQLKNVKGAQAVGMDTVAFDVTAPAESYAAALSKLGL
ncbi:HAD family hydrolase [Salipiger sp. IMCC34102]|uniref:HAD-IA family hydrolase n=1 Tax=Salipiger sp. IMCC34102 TaxID=2510647 RepID=UPI00101D3DD0|nr:HAD-IA family hydrolase [Salipiger sp. IMCC34102]RYH02635.1 HAD family hydrolase [Salipiger sp. IMCC34102]